MSGFLTDLRIALRTLLRAPGFFALSTFVLALGVAVVSVMFGTLRVTLAPPPLPQVDRVFSLTEVDAVRHDPDRWVPLHDLQAWDREQRSFEPLAGFGPPMGVAFRAGGDAAAEPCNISVVTGPFFDVLRVRPLVGRTLTAEDGRPGGPLLAVLAERLWRTSLAADPGVVGRTVFLDGVAVTVVGVVPQALDLPVGARAWVADRTDTTRTSRNDVTYFHPLGRLKDGVSPADAEAELQAIQARRAEKLPEVAHERPMVRPLSNAWLGPEYPRLFRILFASVFLILVLACVNVAGLLLVRGAGRTHEAAVRRALGAGRLRLAGELLAEAVIIGVVAALLAVTLAEVEDEVMSRVVPAVIPSMPSWWSVAPSFSDLAFVVGLALLATLGAALYPAIRTARVSIDPILREGTRDTGRSSALLVRWLVVAEIALSMALLSAAGVVIAAAGRLGHGEVGVPTAGFLVARVELPSPRYPWDKVERFDERLGAKLRAIPGVEAAALTNSLPGCGARWRELYAVEDRSADRLDQLPSATVVQVDQGFFDVFHLPVLRGRALGAADTGDADGAAVVNEALARSLWPDGEPLGKRIHVMPQQKGTPWATIVGVVANVRHDERLHSLGRTPPTIYLPMTQWPAREFAVAVRGPRDPLVLVEAVRAAVRELDPDVPFHSVRTLEEERQRLAAPLVLLGGMFMVFGVVALVLAAAGVYGVLSYSVAQGARETAIRRALGAPDLAIVRAVAARAAWQLGLGLAIGLLLSLAVGAVLGSVLAQESHPVRIYLGVAALLALTLFVSVLVPLRRALRLQPSAALRHS